MTKRCEIPTGDDERCVAHVQGVFRSTRCANRRRVVDGVTGELCGVHQRARDVRSENDRRMNLRYAWYRERERVEREYMLARRRTVELASRYVDELDGDADECVTESTLRELTDTARALHASKRELDEVDARHAEAASYDPVRLVRALQYF